MTSWTVSEPAEIEFDHVRVARVRVVGGSVDVIGTDDTPRLEVSELEGEPLQVSLEDGELVVSYEDLSWRSILSCVAGQRRLTTLSLAVPWDASVQLGVVTAGAVVSGVHGRTAVKSVSGGVTLEGLTDTVEAETISGDLEARSLAGDLRFSTVSGALTVVDGSSVEVRADSVSGEVTLDVDVARDGRLDLSTISGAVRVRLPYKADVTVTMASASGDVDSAFDGLKYEQHQGARRLDGVLGSGSARLNASTVSGDIALLRRTPVRAAR